MQKTKRNTNYNDFRASPVVLPHEGALGKKAEEWVTQLQTSRGQWNDRYISFNKIQTSLRVKGCERALGRPGEKLKDTGSG